MAYCGEKCLSRHTDEGKEAISLRCRAWTCDDCRPLRQAQLRQEALSGSPRTFLTLTFKVRSGVTPAQAAQKLARAWRLLRLRTMRRYKWTNLEFLAVFEATQAGWPHLHILMRAGFIDQRWLSSQMEELLQSPIVHIELVKDARRAARYVSKYIGKKPHRFATCKRYWRSKRYLLANRKPARAVLPYGQAWEREDFGLARFCHLWTSAGWTIVHESRFHARAIKPP